eukprot:TRINITY_DN310_c0_g3_i1.p3 TRINITY_DN310_c0_g3~~TRINITY_DN310_c0_g3_i1.p3  ORF type:complete len:467 (-),score=65.16 TRINITY_DN310_c0_g3_i1:19066-20466(-)
MLCRSFRLLSKSVGLRAASTTACPWKMMDYYYNYDFAKKMEFIDHKMRFPLFRVLDTQGNVLAPEYEINDKDMLMKALETMVTAREMDVVYNNAQRQNRITFYMTGTYEEAANVGAISALKPQDALFLQYREFPMLMWRGITPVEILHNAKGNKLDKLMGKCFPLMHASPEKSIFSTSAPLGDRHPHSAGAGYYFRTKGMDRVAVCVFGEGAASEGDAHASMNFAATLGSQTLFYCRNNCYAISTFRDDQYASDGIAPRAIGYGMPAIKVDGHDLLAVHQAVKKAREMIMERKGPVLVEAYTYRGGDHSTSDSAASYRVGKRMDEIKKYFDSLGDPITRLTNYMKKKGFLENPAEWTKKLGEKVRAECLSNLKALDTIKMPHYDTMFEGVYKEEHWHIKEQKEELSQILSKYPNVYPVHDFPKQTDCPQQNSMHFNIACVQTMAIDNECKHNHDMISLRGSNIKQM